MADGQVAVLPDAGQRERLRPLLQDLRQRVEGVRTVGWPVSMASRWSVPVPKGVVNAWQR